MQKNQIKTIDNWIISDTHYYHNNVIRFCNRPFQDVNEMNRTMIAHHNALVKPNDRVYWLGDVAFCGTKHLTNLLHQLNGVKILIKGNHDDKRRNKLLECGFAAVFDQAIIHHMGYKLKLCHFPYPYTESTEHEYKYLPLLPYDEGHWLLHGHIHNNHDAWTINKELRMINMCVEKWEYKPTNLDAIVKLIMRAENVTDEPKEKRKIKTKGKKNGSVGNRIRSLFKR